jgi:hypothetical protein
LNQTIQSQYVNISLTVSVAIAENRFTSIPLDAGRLQQNIKKTRGILHVKNLLGHKNVNNTLRYIRFAETLDGQEDEWYCKVAKTINEATILIESGFEYVTEMDGAEIFRKRK